MREWESGVTVGNRENVDFLFYVKVWVVYIGGHYEIRIIAELLTSLIKGFNRNRKLIKYRKNMSKLISFGYLLVYTKEKPEKRTTPPFRFRFVVLVNITKKNVVFPP